MKPGRQSIIMEIISQNEIETQNQLLEALAERGIKSTQATLSRDIKDMRLIKELSPAGNYRYVPSTRQSADDSAHRLKKILKESIVSYNVAQNLVIIKTLPGLASAACSAIDAMALEDIIGSIAGDDTAFLALRDNETALKLYQEFEELI